MLNIIIERLNDELSRPAIYRESDQTIHLPADLVRDIVTNLVWAGDEIAQLSEDLSGAIGDATLLREELVSTAAENADLNELVAGYEKHALYTEQDFDYYAGAI